MAYYWQYGRNIYKYTYVLKILHMYIDYGFKRTYTRASSKYTQNNDKDSWFGGEDL